MILSIYEIALYSLVGLCLGFITTGNFWIVIKVYIL